MTVRRGWVERYHDDQLIIGLPDLPAVLAALRGFGVSWEDKYVEKNAELGLARMSRLIGVGDKAEALLSDDRVGPALRGLQEERDRVFPGSSPAHIDLLIRAIRAELARRYPGWEVTIGKNYRPSFVRGYPHIHGGGNGDPVAVPADAPLSQPVCQHDGDRQLGRGVRVGLLDTQLFPGQSLAGHYIVSGDNDVLDPAKGPFTVYDGHCAFVASCILRQAPAAELEVRPVLGDDGEGSTWDAAVAMAELARLGLDVVNLSFGEFLTDDNTAPMVLAAAVKRFGPDTVVVAAAGNNGDVKDLDHKLVHRGVEPNSASYPAALPDVVGVGALDHGKRAAFTPHPAPWIGLLAPGTGLVGAYVRGDVIIKHTDKHGEVLKKWQEPFHGKASWEGCSFAAGVVSGEIAARTVPGGRPAREAVAELLDRERPRGAIMPNRLDAEPAR
jgi:Subtilase family